MTEPTEEDTPRARARRLHDEWRRHEAGDHNDWCYAPLDEVRATMRRAGLSDERLQFVPGRSRRRSPATIPDEHRAAAARHRLVRVDPARAGAPVSAAASPAAC